MPSPIDFYFDFSSPYSFLAAEQIEALAARHGRAVTFRPILLGIVFKTAGSAPLTEQYGPKARYSVHDFERSARFAGVRYRHPSKFPIGAVGASRAVLWLQQQRPEKANEFVRAVFRAFFQDDRDISDAAVVAQIAQSIGLDGPALMEAAQTPPIKDELRRRVEKAVAFGVFGAPTIVIDGEVFWGNDRLPQIERWLASGPF
ncbi:MAG TPA: 2-hydroxychromene-2-carboxylate isomerase [Burkholderiaceae bacterium]|nr:2-hydroxychromene-2-carboxylate isomerase [Burkholderiaceae bacterium]